MRKYFSRYRYARKLVDVTQVLKPFSYTPITDFDTFVKEFHAAFFHELLLEDVAGLFAEAKTVYAQILESKDMKFPTIWNSGENLACILYVLTKLLQPKLVLETGVANGLTTDMILKQLPRDSKLHSFDVNYETLYSVNKNAGWDWHLIDSNNPKKSFERHLHSFSEKFDIWIHDSDHSKFWQTFEYKLALNSLRNGGFLVSDDVNTSDAWESVVTSTQSLICLDGKKIIGIYRLP